MAKRESTLAGKVPIDMTAMIDVVFQLLTFFMLTLKTVIVEGDFNIRMPFVGKDGTKDIPALIVSMTATPEGHLSGVSLAGKPAIGHALLEEIATAGFMVDAALRAGPGNGPQLAAARLAKQVASEKLVASLQKEILETFGNDRSLAALAECELNCDPTLDYDYVISAITAASGIVEGDTVVPLIQKITFSPPRKAN